MCKIDHKYTIIIILYPNTIQYNSFPLLIKCLPNQSSTLRLVLIEHKLFASVVTVRNQVILNRIVNAAITALKNTPALIVKIPII